VAAGEGRFLMMRKLFGFVLLVAIAMGVWWSARWIAERDDLRATIVLPSPSPLHRGSDVTASSEIIGKVTKVTDLGEKTAVAIHVGRQHRKSVLTDSVFEIAGEPPNARLEILSGIAIGSPIADGAVLEPRHDRVTRWLARHGAEIAPALGKLRQRADDALRGVHDGELRAELARWEEKIPEWKEEGSEGVGRQIDALGKRVGAMEAGLRKAKKNVEADRLRSEFNEWLREVRE
jgi:hypothetical protein